MASSILNSIYRKRAARSCNWISAGRKGAAAFARSFSNNWNFSAETKGAARSPNHLGRAPANFSTVSGVLDDESDVLCQRSRISLPWLMLPPSIIEREMLYKFYNLEENKVLSFSTGGDFESEFPYDVVGSSHGWLALFNRSNCDLFLYNPISHRHVKLPPIHNLPIAEPNLRGGYGCVIKLIISCSPDEEDCRAMMSFCPAARLAFCCPGQTKTEWTPIGEPFFFNSFINEPMARVYEDFVYSEIYKQFLCVTQFDDLEGWDLRDPQSPMLDWNSSAYDLKLIDERNCHCASRPDEGWSDDEYERPKYLVFSEETNELFLVGRHVIRSVGPDGFSVEVSRAGDRSSPYKTIGFDVHKIDREKGELKFMDHDSTLNGLAMFIGLNHGFALSTTGGEYPELKPNSIYFTDPTEFTPPYFDKDRAYGGHDLGIYDYETRTISPCYYPCDIQSIKRIIPTPVWLTPSPSQP